MTTAQSRHIVKTLAAVVAVGFGLATIVAGSRVLMGSDPGYMVFRPLLVFNTVMGFVYIFAGVAIWRDVPLGRRSAGVIFVLNFVVLLWITWLYMNSGTVAGASLRAMTLRTVVWLIVFSTLSRFTRTPDTPSPSTPRQV